MLKIRSVIHTHCHDKKGTNVLHVGQVIKQPTVMYHCATRICENGLPKSQRNERLVWSIDFKTFFLILHHCAMELFSIGRYKMTKILYQDVG